MGVDICFFIDHDLNINSMEEFLFEFSNRLKMGKSKQEIIDIVKNAEKEWCQQLDTYYADISMGDYSFRYETDLSANIVLNNEINVYYKKEGMFSWVTIYQKTLGINEFNVPEDILIGCRWHHLYLYLRENPDLLKTKLNILIEGI